MHGGASTGPKTAEGRARIAAARTIHGGYGAAMRAVQAKVSAIVARGRVLRAVVETGFPMEAVTTTLQTVADKQRENTPCAVNSPWFMAHPPDHGRGAAPGAPDPRDDA